MKEGAELQEV